MKLLRYGPPGQERPGLLGDNGQIRDLSITPPRTNLWRMTERSPQ